MDGARSPAGRREVTRTVIAVAIAWALLFGIYYVIPFTDLTSGESLIRLVLGIAAFAVVLAWQLRRVMDADLPVLRAIQALGGTIPLFLVTFAALYLSLSQASTTHFSEPLNHTGALYLAITVFSTVGFGDITPEGDLARIVMSIQMLLDLVVIGAVVRLLTTAAKAGRGDSASGRGSHDGEGDRHAPRTGSSSRRGVIGTPAASTAAVVDTTAVVSDGVDRRQDRGRDRRFVRSMPERRPHELQHTNKEAHSWSSRPVKKAQGRKRKNSKVSDSVAE